MDLKFLMEQAQEMQKKMQDMQSSFADKIYEGTAGGGMVKIHMTGTGDMRKVMIDPAILSPEEKDTIGDLIIAAYNNAKKQAEQESKNAMSGAFGNLSDFFPSKF